MHFLSWRLKWGRASHQLSVLRELPLFSSKIFFDTCTSLNLYIIEVEKITKIKENYDTILVPPGIEPRHGIAYYSRVCSFDYTGFCSLTYTKGFVPEKNKCWKDWSIKSRCLKDGSSDMMNILSAWFWSKIYHENWQQKAGVFHWEVGFEIPV